MIKKKEPKELLIYSNDYSQENFEELRNCLFEEYKEDEAWCSPGDVPEDQIWEAYNSQSEIYWDDEKSRLEQFFDGTDVYLLKETIGRWDRDYEGGFIFTFFREMTKAWESCDCFKLSDRNGHFYIECTHHDGRNFFEVKKITAAGQKYLDNHRFDDRRKLHTNLFESSRYSRLPHYAKHVFGC